MLVSPIKPNFLHALQTRSLKNRVRTLSLGQTWLTAYCADGGIETMHMGFPHTTMTPWVPYIYETRRLALLRLCKLTNCVQHLVQSHFTVAYQPHPAKQYIDKILQNIAPFTSKWTVYSLFAEDVKVYSTKQAHWTIMCGLAIIHKLGSIFSRHTYTLHLYPGAWVLSTYTQEWKYALQEEVLLLLLLHCTSTPTNLMFAATNI